MMSLPKDQVREWSLEMVEFQWMAELLNSCLVGKDLADSVGPGGQVG